MIENELRRLIDLPFLAYVNLIRVIIEKINGEEIDDSGFGYRQKD